MFYYIKGALAYSDITTAVIDAGGVGYKMTVSQTTQTGVLFLDSETGNAYYERVVDGFRQNVAVNNWISTDLSGFPLIRPGYNFVYINGSIEWLRIVPRWWTL